MVGKAVAADDALGICKWKGVKRGGLKVGVRLLSSRIIVVYGGRRGMVESRCPTIILVDYSR